jgi:transposase InsO family protein
MQLVATDAQIRRLRAEMTKTGAVGTAAARAGMCRNTATKYLKTDRFPSEMSAARSWRTRPDPFEQDWPWVEEQIAEEPGLEAKTLFEELVRLHPGRYQDGQLRTLQRRVKQWRAAEGPDKELHLPQDHVPGEAMQTDFTRMNSLRITIAGEAYEHMLCHSTLPYSNWGWATPCLSESLAAFRKGVPAALNRLGRRPEFHQTDNSSAATHSLGSGKRKFNADYVSLMAQLGIKPRTIAVGKKEQNGDIEASNGALKRYIEQQLLLRGSRDFESQADYVAWLSNILEHRNRSRSKRLSEDLAAMQPLRASIIREYTELTVRVTSGATVPILQCSYSVPSRLRGEKVQVRVYDEKIEIYYGGWRQVSTERVRGKGGHRIDYRHIVHSLLRKPGGFRRYRYRDDLFPTQTFRRAFEALDSTLGQRKADIEYLRLLHLAATTMESTVEAELKRQLDAHALPSADEVRDRVAPKELEIPHIDVPVADLSSYDDLLPESVFSAGVLS